IYFAEHSSLTAYTSTSTDVFNRSQPEQHNINGRLEMLPHEQASDVDSVGAASAITSVQERSEHSCSLSLLSPTSQEAIDSSATSLIFSSEEESPLAGSTRQSPSPYNQVTTFTKPTEGVSSQQSQATGDTLAWQEENGPLFSVPNLGLVGFGVIPATTDINQSSSNTYDRQDSSQQVTGFPQQATGPSLSPPHSTYALDISDLLTHEDRVSLGLMIAE
ncbi:hypothetical protein TUN199_08778, partial [Pyrenophora tritici-repentis]